MSDSQPLALVLTGGGARAAYQVGFLRYVATRHPELSPGILTGVSAGAMIATHIAARPGTFADSVASLSEVWRALEIGDVFRVDPVSLTMRIARWGLRLVSGGAARSLGARSLVDTTPLGLLLTETLPTGPDGTFPGIARNLTTGSLDAVALTASSYTTGQSVTWVESREGCGFLTWEGPRRTSGTGCLRIDHVMASAALPFFFPAVEVDRAWYGDGGIRLTAPLSPAVHLGARRIMVVSTRYAQTRGDATQPSVSRYPPPAQVGGVLLNAIFLDLLDSDTSRLQQVNWLVDRVPPERRDGLRHIDLLVLRPSQDLGLLANRFETRLPRGFRFLVRGLGSRETRSNDLLSLLMFQPDYIAQLMALGEADARARAAEIDAFLAPDSASGSSGAALP